jgi:energy-coupling factor transporter ATP-binding protein EcfA2
MPDDLPRDIASKDVSERILSGKRIVITGPDDCGKTALSKMLYLDANSRFGRSCVLLCGKKLKGKGPREAFTVALDDSIKQQYGLNAVGRYAGLDSTDRVLIIDDWEDVPFNRAGKAEILNCARTSFQSIILLADDVFMIEETSAMHRHAPLADFEVVDIREFGFRLRGQMVRKWHDLGNTFAEDEETRARHIAESTRVIDSALGRNLFPSHPVNILTLLQTYDASAGSQSAGLGSYGQVYEALITARLVNVSVKSIDIGTKITFLARFAWRLFEERQRTLSEAGWKDLGDQYYREYKIRVDCDQLRSSCVSAGILSEDDSGIRFTYGYGYCYFVAKYFQENLANSDDESSRADLFEKLKAISARVYNENNANIVIFYVFLTKDRTLINHIISSARHIFRESPEFDFDSHIQFINRIISPPELAQLPASRPDENQQAYDQRRDEAGEEIEPNGDPGAGDVLYAPNIPFEQKLIIGIRYLTLMGQILRNFPGSLKADTKLELAFESYSLGLRALATIFILSQRDSELLTREIVRILRDRMAYSGTERELMDRAELVVAEMLRHITYGLLKRISHAVGLSELEDTYVEVSELRDNNLADKFVHLSIHLDHFEHFPKKEIEALKTDVRDNNFSFQTLQDLVLNHLYLFPRDYSIQQWSGSTLGMKVNIPSIRGSDKKLLGS